MLTFGSLFAGIGGFDLGFERAGMKCLWQVEIDDYANRVLAKHWPDVRRHGDVRTWPQPDTEPVDVVCGGFPCQDISNAGKRAGLDGNRSGLFYEIIRIAGELRPRFVVLENVAALLNRGFDRVLGELATLGFDAEWHCIPASAVGAPHQRDRVWIVAYTKGKRHREWGESRNICQTQQRPDDELFKQFGFASERERVLANTQSQRQQGQRAKEQQAGFARCSETQPKGRGGSGVGSTWTVEPNVGRVAHGVSNRVDRLRCLGNAIVPQVAELVGRRVIEIAGMDNR